MPQAGVATQYFNGDFPVFKRGGAEGVLPHAMVPCKLLKKLKVIPEKTVATANDNKQMCNVSECSEVQKTASELTVKKEGKTKLVLVKTLDYGSVIRLLCAV